MSFPDPPPGFRIDPFADARMGVSLFQMAPEDWLLPDCRCGSGSPNDDCPLHGKEPDE